MKADDKLVSETSQPGALPGNLIFRGIPNVAKKASAAVELPPFVPPTFHASRVDNWPLKKIKPYPRNANDHPPEQIELLARHMMEFGVTTAITVDPKGVIIGGHGRLLAAMKNGFEEYPVVVITGLTDVQIAAARLADNWIPKGSVTNPEMMKLELDFLQLNSFDMPLGISDTELQGFLNPDIPGEAPEDEVPEPPAVSCVRLADMFVLGEHRILCGDSTKAEDVDRVTGGRKPNLMVTDPPYGGNYDPNWRTEPRLANKLQHSRSGAMGAVQNDTRIDWRAAWDLFRGDVAYVWQGDRQSTEGGGRLIDCGFEIRNLIVWAKHRMVISRGHYHPQHEVCCYAVRKGGTANWTGDRKQTTLWNDIPPHQKSETGHSTQKPVECMKRPIINNSKKGEYIYEPFSGSGTTIIAAETTGRRCLAIELTPAFVEVAVRRWEKFTGKIATLETGETLEQLAKSRKAGNRRKPIRGNKPVAAGKLGAEAAE